MPEWAIGLRQPRVSRAHAPEPGHGRLAEVPRTPGRTALQTQTTRCPGSPQHASCSSSTLASHAHGSHEPISFVCGAYITARGAARSIGAGGVGRTRSASSAQLLVVAQQQDWGGGSRFDPRFGPRRSCAGGCFRGGPQGHLPVRMRMNSKPTNGKNNNKINHPPRAERAHIQAAASNFCAEHQT
jgi:hypothetical protein